MSSIINRETVKESEIVSSPLSDENFRTVIKNWKKLFLSCFGPYGSTVMVQNTVGGSVTVTNSSSCLLENFQPSHHVMKIVSSVIKEHCKVWKDTGLFSMILISEILELSVSSDLSSSKVAIILEHFGSLISEHFSSECSSCKFKIGLTNLTHLNSAVRTVLQAKLLCMLSRTEISYLTTVCLQAFLACIPDSLENSRFGEINFILCDGYPIIRSKFYPGYLYLIVDIPSLKLSKLHSNGKVAFFDISLAGDYDSEILNYQHEANKSFSLEDVILPRMLKITDQLVKLNVIIVACQKVVHPRIKKALRKRNIICMERLGREGFNKFINLSHGIPISSFFEEINHDFLGNVKEINCIEIFGKNYLQVLNDNNGGTILLCHRTEESLQDLKIVCKQALHATKLLMSYPEVYVGAGCLEAHLIITLQNIILDKEKQNDIAATSGQIKKIFLILTRSLKIIIQHLHPTEHNLCVDVNSGHLFASTTSPHCCCGLRTLTDVELTPFQFMPTMQKKRIRPKINEQLDFKNIENSILDIGISKLSSYQKIFEILSTILKIEHCIIDKN